MSPEFSFVAGVLLIAAALAALTVCLDIGPSPRKVVRSRLNGVHAPVPGKTKKKNQSEFFAQNDQLGPLRYVVRRTVVQRLERNLILAGLSSTWRISTLVLIKIVGPGAFLVPLLLWFGAGPSIIRFGIMAGLLALLYALPNLVVKGRATERQQQILYELPDVLDQVTISVESGLGFEASLARVGKNSKGPLAAEVARVVQDSRLGMSRRDAYNALADRTDVDDLKRFLKSIVQAEEFGVPISKVVRTQAEELRTKRRQRAEEKAAKVALKLLFPMLVCMFPVLFILILTPAIVNMGKVL